MTCLASNIILLTQHSGTIINPDLFTSVLKYEGEPLPALPHTESWIFSVVFMLFLFLIFSVNRSYSWIVDALKNILKVRTRSSIFSKTTVDEYQSRFLLTIFSVGVISLYIYLQFFPAVGLSLKTYLLLCLAGLLFIFVKELIARLISYTFLEHELFRAASENYYNILSFLGFLLYPLLILKLYFHDGLNVKLFDVLSVFFSLSALIFIAIKYFQIFYRKILDFFHIMLYLCTLEILPLFGLFQVYKWIINEF